MENAREFQGNIYFCFIDHTKAFDCMGHNKLWKILKAMGIPDHLTCLLRNVYADKEAIEPDTEQLTGSKLKKECDKAVCCHHVYLAYVQSASCEMKVWMNHKLESIARRNINNFRYAEDTILMADNEKELKSLLMRVEMECEKSGLKLNIQKIKIMALSPITSWQIEGEKVEAVTDLIFLVSKITLDSDCSHEIKRCLLLGRKTMTNLDNILKSKDITLPIKVHIVNAMVFPVVMYGYEGWTDCKEG